MSVPKFFRPQVFSSVVTYFHRKEYADKQTNRSNELNLFTTKYKESIIEPLDALCKRNRENEIFTEDGQILIKDSFLQEECIQKLELLFEKENKFIMIYVCPQVSF